MATKGEAAKAPASQPKNSVKLNDNGKPILNTNTVAQAQKPSKAPITLPAIPGVLPDLEQFDAVKDQLEAKTKECFEREEQVTGLLGEVDRLKKKANKLRGILSRQGVSVALET